MKEGIDLLAKGFKFLLVLVIFIIIAFALAMVVFPKGIAKDKYIVGKVIQWYPEYKEYPLFSDRPLYIEPKNILYTRVMLIIPSSEDRNRTTVGYYIK